MMLKFAVLLVSLLLSSTVCYGANSATTGVEMAMLDSSVTKFDKERPQLTPEKNEVARRLLLEAYVQDTVKIIIEGWLGLDRIPKLSDRIIEDLGGHELDVLEILFEIELEFGIEISAINSEDEASLDELINATVGDILKWTFSEL